MAVVPAADELVGRARTATGLTDMGPSGWETGLEVLVDSANAEAELNDLGVAVVRSWIRDRLANRLRLVDWAKSHPVEVAGPIERPLVVTGLGRSGTTYLLELLAADPGSRALMRWEALDSIPPPERASFDSDPRIAACVEHTERVYDAAPELRAVHYEHGDGPTECLALLGMSFRGTDFAGLFTMPSFLRWYLTDDQRPAYAFHRLTLGVLQSRAPGPWVLKDPWHLMALDALLEVYRDSRVVVLHRNPSSVVGSIAGLSVATRPDALRVAPVDPTYWGRQWLEALGTAADRYIDGRTRHPSE